MEFRGFQKMTLLDYPGKVACTLFTGGCSFRCPFCHNAVLVLEPEEAPAFPEEEVLRYLEKRRGLLDGVCVTGGEPLLQEELPAFLERVKTLGYSVKLDTNGAHPEALKSVVRAGLVDYAAMDIKNQPEKYAVTAGLPNLRLAAVEESVRFLMEGSLPFEFRTTVVRELHTVEDIRRTAEWIRGDEAYYLQAFTDSGGLIGGPFTAYTPSEMEEMRAAAAEFVPNTALRGV